MSAGFHGGIHPPDNKAQSAGSPIRQAPLPSRLILPLSQHLGTPARPCVSIGQWVGKGQLIAEPSSAISAALHAPSSGTVVALGDYPYPHASGLLAPALVIDCDGRDQWVPLQGAADFRQESPQALLQRIRQAGISGLGGAGFPTAAKLVGAQQGLRYLIINGVECEPYITADDRLMRERAEHLLQGVDILRHMLQPEQTLLAIEDNKPQALAAVQQALNGRPLQLEVIPTCYPSGSERQLIEILTDQQVPSGGKPLDIGMLCLNVGTAAAIADAVLLGRPLISRITTLTGGALAQPGNLEALIGTPVGELLTFAGLDPSKLERLIMGGPLMGISLTGLDVPLIKTSNCLLAATREELPAAPPAMPCIRCGDCAQVCPASLLPQQLYFFALGEQHAQLQAHNLFDCIECGACAYVCPSSIPLVHYYRAAKGEIREAQERQRKADIARQRFEQRQERLLRLEQRRAAERQARQARAEQGQQQQPEAQAPLETLKRLKIEASMAQVALKKLEKQLAQQDSAELREQRDQLEAAAQAARAALSAAEAEATAPSNPAPDAAQEAALKQAKIDTAMARAQLKKSSKAFGEQPSPEQQAILASLQQDLERHEQHLQALQPITQPSPGEQALRQAKQAYVTQRDALRQAEQQGATDLAPLQQALHQAEQALHAAEAASGKAPPDLQRTDKRPISAKLRTLKTELAYARAELHKAQRQGAAAPELAAAQARLQAAEQALADAADEE